MAGDESDFAALCLKVVDGFLDCLGYGTHGDDDVLGLRVAVVCERTVLSSGEFADLAHVAGNDVRNLAVELVP